MATAVERHLLGDKEARGRLITNFVPYVWRIVRSNVERSLVDDVYSEVILRVIKGVDRFVSREGEKDAEGFVRYIKTIVIYSMKDARIYGVVRVPPRTFRRKARDGYRGPKLEEINDDVVSHNHWFPLDLREIIDLCVHDEIEDEILNLRLEGFNDREIGDILGCSLQRVNQIRGRLRQRFQCYFKEMNHGQHHFQSTERSDQPTTCCRPTVRQTVAE